MVGSVYFADASIAHATSVQAGSTVTADRVISGTGLGPGALRQVLARPGVRAAAGLAPVSVAATDPDLEQVYGEAVAGGPLDRVLDLGVTSGGLAQLRPGQIAVSSMEAAPGAMGVHVGSRITVYLPDGTPYRATVSAVYARSLASGDLLLPAAAVAGHTGTPPAFAQILVSGGTAGALAAGHPGWHVASRAAANAAAARAAAQNGFANNLILGVMAALAARWRCRTRWRWRRWSGGGCCGCSAGSARPAARWPRRSPGTCCSSPSPAWPRGWRPAR